MKARLVLLAAVAVVAGSIGLVSVRRAGDQLAVMEACDAVQQGRFQDALARTEGRTGDDEVGRAAAECRCRALLASDRGPECEGLLEAALSDTDEWMPAPDLSVHLIQTFRDAGRSQEAADLARRAGSAHPASPDLFYLELVTRGAVENEEALLRELQKRMAPRGPEAVRMRTSLANRHLLRSDPGAALEALGPVPPPGSGPAVAQWFEMRGLAQAHAGDLAALRRTYQRWRDVGGDPRELGARYALTLSIGKITDPKRPTLAALQAALSPEPADPRLAEALTIRLILALVNAQRFEEAVAAYDRGRERFALEGLTRDELLRARRHHELGNSPGVNRRGTLRFAVEGAGPGWQLHVSPETRAPVDSPYERHAVPKGGVVRVERAVGLAPARWVLRDREGRVRGSGTTGHFAGSEIEVPVMARPPLPHARFEPRRLPADGRRRVVWLLLDCADWRLSRYLLTRGELPVLASQLETGHRAVLWSDPPLTAAALEALVWPQRSRSVSFVGLLHRFGIELAGLSSIGDNPFDALRWLLPESRDLFTTVGAGDAAAANLLFAHGGINAGRHGEVTGPRGERRRVPIGTSARDLTAEERERFPALAAVTAERDRIHLRTIAAEFDAAETLVQGGELDLVALRIEPLDILTHAHFASAVRDGQDDGEGLLFSVYRYIDARLGGVHQLLDEDDVLVVMSDHGIRTSMEHAPEAIFVATGAGLAPGRSLGTPALHGVSRVLAGWLGVETDWPETGVAPALGAPAGALPKGNPRSAALREVAPMKDGPRPNQPGSAVGSLHERGR
jgi:hypothetical protein